LQNNYYFWLRLQKNMRKNYYLLPVFILFLSVFTACSDDDDYIPIANPPIAVDDVVSSTLTAPVIIPVLANDTTGGVPIPATVSIINGVDSDSNGTLDQLVVANEGTWSVNAATGEITFTPTPTFTGNPTPIRYIVQDEDGSVSNEAIVTINAVAIVNGDLSAVPFPNLSDYHFFIGDIKDLTPSLNVIPYEPASSLFTDYALKKRFIWMPADVRGTYVADNQTLEFPVGTILIKNFYYNTIQPGNVTKIIETRLMVRRADRWYFYEYVWNDAQTDAALTTGSDFDNGDTKYFTFTKPNGEVVNEEYRIPSEAECHACHKINEVRTPIGLKPQNINFNLSYNNGSKNQLLKLLEQGYLQSYPSNIVSTVDYHDTTKPVDLRFRSYVDANCAHCHQDLGRCDYRALRFNFGETLDIANLGVCVQADEVISPTLQKLITPGNYNKSILHYRLITNDESERMPLLGRTIVHDEGIALVREYILSLSPCN
jgi:uncharacterized repeat protein (TIGR03806 family)